METSLHNRELHKDQLPYEIHIYKEGKDQEGCLGVYVHKPQSFNPDVYVNQIQDEDGYYWLLYYYNEKDDCELGSWRISVCDYPDGSGQTCSDPNSPYLGYGFFYPKGYQRAVSEKFTDQVPKTEDSYGVKFFF